MFKNMKSVYQKLGLLLAIIGIASAAQAAEIKNLSGKNTGNTGSGSGLAEFASTCKSATQSADLDINNVRT